MKKREEIGAMMTSKGYMLAAEVGVQKGEFARKMLSSWNGHLVLVDSWRSFNQEEYEDVANVSDEEHFKNYRECLDNLREFEGRFTTCRALSPEVSTLFKNNLFDLVYIDANHSYEGCLRDISHWNGKVRSGGCICGHDYMDGVFWGGTFGVKKAVLEFFGREPDIVTDESEPSWFFFK